MANNFEDIVAYYKGRPIRLWQFHCHVRHLLDTLPDHKYSINLCEDRYHYLVAFVACMLKRQTTLLPSSRAVKEIERIGHIYRSSYVVTDQNEFCIELPTFYLKISSLDDSKSALSLPAFDPQQIAVIVFTSGSTGMPQAYPKRWRELEYSARLTQNRFGLQVPERLAIVATVPPQHMFGFEMGIVLPLVTGIIISGEMPFFPFDIKKTLDSVPERRILITTPIHLKACHSATIDWPQVDLVISAAAPLSIQLAKSIEKDMCTEVREIYGCSETGAIASRRTSTDEMWTLYDKYQLESRNERVWFHSPGMDEQIRLADKVEIIDDFKFKLLGRGSDFINIGGKRGSLADLNYRLKKIPGIEDGVFILPEEDANRRTRLAALVVAPCLSESEIFKLLSEQIDDVFLPRPIRKVGHLPYNENGKLPRRNLLDLLYPSNTCIKKVGRQW